MAQAGSAEFDALAESAVHRAGVDPRDDEQRRVLGISEFMVRSAQRSPAEFQAWLDNAPYTNPTTTVAIGSQVDALRTEFADRKLSTDAIPELQRALRRLRDQIQRVLIWRHLAGRAEYAETVAGLTAFADAMIQLSLDWALRMAVAKDGVPQDQTGTAQQLVVLALGKLGGGELNLSSDIDLICCYPEPGTTSVSARTNQQFFVGTVQMLVKLLSEVTADGFVFRVDLRLRPFGESGALVEHFAAFERYYESNGRDWERYALIKARTCAGDLVAGAALLERLQSFIYRRYLDFAAIEALRDMRGLIQKNQQAHLANVKLGAGGIRDIEFFAQMLQLIWGGKEPKLRTARLEHALQMLVEVRLLQVEDRDKLWQTYCLFRAVEHVLQGLRDEQTHSLPDAGSQSSRADQIRLAAALGYANYAQLTAALTEAREWVSQQLDRWLLKPTERSDSAGAKLWFDAEFEDQHLEEVPGRTLILVEELRRSAARSDVAAIGRQRLDALMPVLLDELQQRLGQHRVTAPLDTLLLRIVPLLQNVVRRSAYLVVLAESAEIRSELLELCFNGGYFPQLLARHPTLLDELFLPEGHEVPTAAELEAQLCLVLPELGSVEPRQENFDALAQFKCQHQFRALLAFVRGELDVMQLGDFLSRLAELVIERVLLWAWAELVEADERSLAGFVVIAYGKLGSYEMGSQSDLDLVFVHDWASTEHALLHKLVRRFLNYVGMQTYFGALYEVDIRLRPAGRAGNLVTSFAGYERYQSESAWVWEHQALLRARPVAGCDDLAQRFAALRRQVLSQPRDLLETQREVVAMREKMLTARAPAHTAPHTRADGDVGDSLWDLKKDVGGIVDIEFMVQYLVLVYAQDFPGLVEYSDNVRTLAAMARFGQLTQDQAMQLSADYRALRSAAQLVALRDGDAEALRDEFDLHKLRQRVRDCWQTLMSAPEA